MIRDDGLLRAEREAWRRLVALASHASQAHGATPAADLERQARACRKVPMPLPLDGRPERDPRLVETFRALIVEGIAWRMRSRDGRLAGAATLAHLAEACGALLAPDPPPAPGSYERPPPTPRKDIYG